MNVIETFLKLTSRTYPHGTENEIFDLLPIFLETDEFGNKYYQIGDSPSCMFTSHLDTATTAKSDVVHVIKDNICKTDGTSILGADDKAGVTIMLWMIHNNIPGLYYFFLGEEVGCIGSKALANKLSVEKIENINKVISFDRRGFDSVITYQASSRCCSDNFAKALTEQLNTKNEKFNYKIDPSGIWTDSAQFVKIYPECTNISVGYKNEHTSFESQDFDHLVQLANTCLLVDWEALPVERDPSVVDYKYSYSRYDYYGYDSDFGDFSTGSGGSYYKSYSEWSGKKDNKYYFYDEVTNYISSVTLYYGSKIVKDIELSDERIEIEASWISDILDSLDIQYQEIYWDGLFLKVVEDDATTVKYTREDLSEFISSLNFWHPIVEFQNSEDAWSKDSEFRDRLENVY